MESLWGKDGFFLTTIISATIAFFFWIGMELTRTYAHIAHICAKWAPVFMIFQLTLEG